MVLGVGEADVEIHAEGLGDRLAEVSAERLARHAPHHLADEPPERDRVIAVRAAGLPPRRFRRERRHHGVPIVERFSRQELFHRGESRAVAQEKTNGDRSLSRLGELGPVARDRRVEIDAALLDQLVQTERGHALRGREDVDDRVALPGAASHEVRMPRPEIDDRTSVDRERDGRADLVALAEVLREDLAHPREAGIDRTVDRRRVAHDAHPRPRPRPPLVSRVQAPSGTLRMSQPTAVHGQTGTVLRRTPRSIKSAIRRAPSAGSMRKGREARS